MSEERPDDPPIPPSPPPAPPPEGRSRSQETPLVEYLHAKTRAMERDLALERERARNAADLLKQQESLRAEVQSQLKNLSEQIRQQKNLQESEEEKRSSHGRIEALEQRLDEMFKAWASLLKEPVPRKEEDGRKPSEDCRSLAGSMEELRREFSLLKDSLGRSSPASGELSELRALVPALAKARSEDERLLREQLREMLEGLGKSLGARLRELDERLARDAAHRDARLQALERERTALAQTLESGREDLRRQAAAQRAADEERLQQQFCELRNAVLELCQRHAASCGDTSKLQQSLEELRAVLARPEKARDEILQGLEGEKRDLMQALRERTEQLRGYVVERREIERSLGESLMDMNRRLEEERDAHRKTRERIAALEQTIEALKAQGGLRAQELCDRQARNEQLAAERDMLLQALAEEAEKVRRQICGRTENDRAWEEKILGLQKNADDERQKRMQAEQAACDARAQTQSLTDHISRLIREKDAVESRYQDWERRRVEMEEQLRKKDEMLGILSTTFRNILKKPGEPVDRTD